MPEAEGRPENETWQYLGIGCMTAVVGLIGGGMIAVFIAKIVGAVRHCTPDSETGAPCGWGSYWTWGARIGFVLLPTLVLWRLYRGRHGTRNSERG